MLPPLASLFGLGIGRLPWRERWISSIGGATAIALILIVSRGGGRRWRKLDCRIDGRLCSAAVCCTAQPTFAALATACWAPSLGHHSVSPVRAGLPIWSWLLAEALDRTIFAMRALAWIHPPGGATALAAVIGGPQIKALGFAYVLSAVMLNLAILLGAAISFHYPFAWRRYPAALHRMERLDELVEERPPIAHANLVYALSALDAFINVSEQDLLRIDELAIRHADAPAAPTLEIKPHACYSNGRCGADWQVREVLQIRDGGEDERHVVSFHIAAGKGRRRTVKCGLLAFRR